MKKIFAAAALLALTATAKASTGVEDLEWLLQMLWNLYDGFIF